MFIPELLQQTAHVESRDPETGQMIRLDVSPNEVTAAPEVVVSFPLPDSSAFVTSAGNVMAKFCHFVFLGIADIRRATGREASGHILIHAA